MTSKKIINRPLPIYVLFVTIILIISGCDFIEDLFGKDDPKNDPQNISNTGSLVIGADGGTVSLGNMEISVSTNTFSSDNTITINELTSDDGFGENAISSIYQIEGLPESTNKPIKM